MVAKKPKWGYRGRHLLGRDDIVIYSVPELRNLAKLAKVTRKADIEEMRRRLEGAANVYRISLTNHDKSPRPAEIRAAIRKVGKLAARLKDCLDQLDDTSWKFFWPPEGRLDLAAAVEESSIRLNHIAPRGVTEEGRIVAQLKEGDIHDALTILKKYSADALKRVPVDPGGAKSGESLRIWAINIQDIWMEYSGKKYTLNYDGIAPLSYAACFTVDAFNPIDPKVPNSRIFNAMRQVIKGPRRHT